MHRFRRRDVLAMAGLAAAAGVSGCARAGADDARTLRATTYIPESYDDLYPGIKMFLDTAAAQPGSELAFDLFDSGTLLGAEQLLPGLLLDVTDVMFQTSSYVTSTYPILGAMQLPFVTNDYAQHRRAMAPGGPLMALMNERLAGKNVRLLGGMPTSFEYLWTVDAPVRKPEDVAGMRIRVAGEIEGVTIKALGGAPVFMGSSEVYQALERGTIDGMVSYLGTVFARDLQEIIRYGTAARFGAYTVDAYCREDFYRTRPAPVRAAFDAGGRAIYERGTQHMVDVHNEEYLPAVTAGGVELVHLSSTELAAFRHAVEPVYGHWREVLGDDRVAATAIDLIEKA